MAKKRFSAKRIDLDIELETVDGETVSIDGPTGITSEKAARLLDLLVKQETEFKSKNDSVMSKIQMLRDDKDDERSDEEKAADIADLMTTLNSDILDFVAGQLAQIYGNEASFWKEQTFPGQPADIKTWLVGELQGSAKKSSSRK